MAEQIIIDGNVVARNIRNDLRKRVHALQEQGISPCLSTILVGNNPASDTYVQMKGNACKRVGIQSRRIHLPETTTTEELIATIHSLNEDKAVHGILLQHPVPSQIDEREAFEAIALAKDVDGVTALGFGYTAFDLDGYSSCTSKAILTLLDAYKVPIEGKHAVVVGRSPILGKPVSAMLLNRNATVTICHSRTHDLEKYVGLAYIVVAAVGRPEFIKGAWLKLGCVVMRIDPRCLDIAPVF